MKIGDILFFAPGIKFSEVNLNAAEFPGLFGRRISGFYLDPADLCARDGLDFASGALLVSCIDALARFRFGGDVGARFRKFLLHELGSFAGGDFTERFYDEFRNGLVHEARIKNGGQFSREAPGTVQLIDGLLVVNPARLGAEVRSALGAYVTLLERDRVEREKLASHLATDLAVDFHTARL